MANFNNRLAFFANSCDLTKYFLDKYCRNVAQGVSIKNFIKKYPDAVYTTARLSGDEYLVSFSFPILFKNSLIKLEI